MDTGPPQALDWRPDSVFVQAGGSQRDARVGGLGLRWAWALPVARGGDGVSGAVEVSLGRWSSGVTLRRTPPEATRDRAVQLVAMPLVRWQPQQGRSAWFLEAGVGLSLHDRPYRVGRKRQSSRLNFQEEIGLGRALAGGHAVSLRLAHMSNAGLRKPNPGETWWSLRWEQAF